MGTTESVAVKALALHVATMADPEFILHTT